MPDPVLDTSTLTAAVFVQQGGMPTLLTSLSVPAARVPAEVYNADEDGPLADDDVRLSALARDMRARRNILDQQHWARTQREHAALRRGHQQLQAALKDGHLIIELLTVHDLRRRDELQRRYDLSRAEAASLVLAERSRAALIFPSASGPAFEAAYQESISVIAIQDTMAA